MACMSDAKLAKFQKIKIRDKLKRESEMERERERERERLMVPIELEFLDVAKYRNIDQKIILYNLQRRGYRLLSYSHRQLWFKKKN